MKHAFLKIKNGERVHRESIPHLPFDVFCDQLISFVFHKGHIVQFFAYMDPHCKWLVVLRNSELYVAGCDVPEKYLSFTLQYEKFHMFEREMAEQYAIKPMGHPWLKSVRYHHNYPGKPDCFGNDYFDDIPGCYPFYSIQGEDIHEVGVGPVHAGIIEPGHFRFNCIGEKVLHLEIQLGYQHRGVEQLMVKAPLKRLPIIIEGIAGDTAIANSICFSQAVEALSSISIDQDAQIARTIVLELERLSNHIGDLGALSHDVAFLMPAAYYGRIRGDFLNMLLLLSGNRFGKGWVRPGGVNDSITDDQRQQLIKSINLLRPQIEHVGDLLFNNSGVLARFESTGCVSAETSEKIGLVGVAGRASGSPYDVRHAFPSGFYTNLNNEPKIETTGDVLARAKVRYREIKRSLHIIETLLQHPNHSDMRRKAIPFHPSAFVVTLNEAWRGELSHCIITDKNGNILRYKVKDPSFHNWTGLALALRGQEISDFPLCNKSFNLSYCGFDL
ncbi:MAG: hydrogenase [Candidatus Magnetomorum sp.]|nr:hydrogenase [Candidatus Magnetomorum sp.]